jgi:Uma2 family endonuclease
MGIMASAQARPRKTIEDLQALSDDVRAELIDGGLYVTPSPSTDHQRAVGRIHEALARHAREAAGGEVLLSPLDVHLPSGDVVQPDLLWVSPARLGILGEQVHGAPDLVVEVVSATNAERDRIVKRALYARNGVHEYWIVDLDARGVEVLVGDGRVFVPAGWFTPGARLRSRLLPGLAPPVIDLLPPPRAR